MPWFVSDVTLEDLQWTLEFIATAAESSAGLKQLAAQWKANFDTGRWVYEADDYWTMPYDYSAMHTESPDLFKSLSSASLIIFKGDLNYRKLTGDLKWPYDSTTFEQALRGFGPSALCALRTVKCDLAVGIGKEGMERASEEDDWMLTGRWGVIQFQPTKL